MQFLSDIWAEIRPQAVLAVVTIVGALLSFAVAKALETLKTIKDEKLALSVYRTITNLLKAAVARRAINGAPLGPETTGAIVKEVIDGTKSVNAKAVKGLKQSDAALYDKVLARLPEAKAEVTVATAKSA